MSFQFPVPHIYTFLSRFTNYCPSAALHLSHLNQPHMWFSPPINPARITKMTAQFPTDSPQFSTQQPVQLHFFNTFTLSQTQQVTALKPQLHTIQSKRSIISTFQNRHKTQNYPLHFQPHTNYLGNFCSEMYNWATEKEVITQYPVNTFQVSVNHVCK
jgi:hypothetical protein